MAGVAGTFTAYSFISLSSESCFEMSLKAALIQCFKMESNVNQGSSVFKCINNFTSSLSILWIGKGFFPSNPSTLLLNASEEFLSQACIFSQLEFHQLCQEHLAFDRSKPHVVTFIPSGLQILTLGAVHVTFFGRPLGHSGNCLLFLLLLFLKITFIKLEAIDSNCYLKELPLILHNFQSIWRNCVKKTNKYKRAILHSSTLKCFLSLIYLVVIVILFTDTSCTFINGMSSCMFRQL